MHEFTLGQLDTLLYQMARQPEEGHAVGSHDLQKLAAVSLDLVQQGDARPQ